MRTDAALDAETKKAVRNDLLISTVIFLVTLATRFYKLEHPAKIGKDWIGDVAK